MHEQFICKPYHDFHFVLIRNSCVWFCHSPDWLFQGGWNVDRCHLWKQGHTVVYDLFTIFIAHSQETMLKGEVQNWGHFCPFNFTGHVLDYFLPWPFQVCEPGSCTSHYKGIKFIHWPGICYIRYNEQTFSLQITDSVYQMEIQKPGTPLPLIGSQIASQIGRYPGPLSLELTSGWKQPESVNY